MSVDSLRFSTRAVKSMRHAAAGARDQRKASCSSRESGGNGGTADAAVLKTAGGRPPCGFESHFPHRNNEWKRQPWVPGECGGASVLSAQAGRTTHPYRSVGASDRGACCSWTPCHPAPDRGLRSHQLPTPQAPRAAVTTLVDTCVGKDDPGAVRGRELDRELIPLNGVTNPLVCSEVS